MERTSRKATDMTVTRDVALCGTTEPFVPPPILSAGPLTCELDAGNLRHVKLAGKEAIRAISMIVRDRNWGTYNPEITDLVTDQRADGFTVSYRAACGDSGQRLTYSARIEGRASGELEFVVEALAETAFVTNRAGFVVLHGVDGIVGQPVTVEHVDGTIVESRFPDAIDPLQPFKDIRTLTHEVLPGVRVACRMEGDAYEMEDQRNWMDASYKTYIRPLELPWPYTLDQGQRLDLRVSLAVTGTVPNAGGTASDQVGVTIDERAVGTMPRLALVVPAPYAALALDRLELLRRPAFPVYALSLIDGVTTTTLETAVDQLKAFRALVEGSGRRPETFLEAVLPCRDPAGVPTDDVAVLERDMSLLAQAVERAGLRFDRIAVSPSCDMLSTPPGSVWPKAPSWEAVAAAARAAFPGIPFSGGMSSYFTELNRKRPPHGLHDFVGHGTTPTVHAADDLSVTEGLEALPSIFRSARGILGETTPYILYPTTFSMRFNPYGATTADNPRQIRVAMAKADPRERGLLGAAWYAGYLAHAARYGLDTLCLGAAVGPSGIVHARQPYAQPWFDEVEAAVRPSWHVLASHAGLAGATVLDATTSAPREIQVLAVRGHGTLTIWLANLTHERRTAIVHGLDLADAYVGVLDAAGFTAACRDPDHLDRAMQPLADAALELDAYAVARIVLPG